MRGLAIDVGGSHIRYGLVGKGKVLRSHAFEVDPQAGMRVLLPGLADRLRSLLTAECLEPNDVGGIGLSFPAIVDSKTATVKWIPKDKFEDAPSIDFRQWAREMLGLSLVLENDANMALLGEWQFGAGQGCNDLVHLTLGTGIGTAAVIEGRPLRGKHFQAGCLGGFQVVNFDGAQRSNGYRGYAECEASTWVLPEILKADPLFAQSTLSEADRLDYRTLFDHAEAHADPLARTMVDRSIEVWAAVIVNLIHAYDPGRVILSGGLMQRADGILPRIREAVARLAHTYWGTVQIRKAHHIEEAALLGAWYAIHQQTT